MRTNLLNAITTATSTLTQFSVSQELPWTQAGDPLYIKNMKKIYVDNATFEQSTILFTFEKNNLDLLEYTCNVYLTVDAKNPPSQTQQVLTNILNCKNKTGLISYDDESDYTVETQEDKLIYTIQFRSSVATT